MSVYMSLYPPDGASSVGTSFAKKRTLKQKVAVTFNPAPRWLAGGETSAGTSSLARRMPTSSPLEPVGILKANQVRRPGLNVVAALQM